jgi:ligand-binding sensor domain-containing protein/tRNA A-37 threonylcarbamoyl transferase component Bud32
MGKKKSFKEMKCLWIVFLCVLSTFVFSVHLHPQNNIKFERITIEQGLSQNTVYAIIQDNKGFLWFGTEDGLNRYDGYNFKVYKHNPDDPTTLSNNRVQAIYEDNSGIIWIGTHGGGLNKFDRRKEIFIHYTSSPSDPNSLSNNIIWTICEGESGKLWIGTDNGLNRFAPKTGKFIRCLHDPNNPDSLSNNRVKAICKDKSEGIWIGTMEGGLNKLILSRIQGSDRRREKFVHHKHNPNDPGSLSHNEVYAIHMDKTGELWIGTSNVLNKFDQQRGQFIKYKKEPGNLFNPSKYIASLTTETKDKSDVLWIGTYGDGLYQFDRKRETYTHYKHVPGNPNSLSSNYIQTIYQDKTGVLWIGTDSGLNKYDKKREKFGHYKTEPDNLNSLSNNNVCSIYKDRAGTLWIGTEGGLDRFDRKNNKFTHWKIGNSTDSLDNKKIMSIFEDRKGILWVSAFEDGLYQFDQKKKILRHYKHNPTNPTSLSNNRVNTIYEDKFGILWIGTIKGLNRFNRKKKTFSCYTNIPEKNNSLCDNFIYIIYEDQTGLLWIGTKGGLNLFHRESETFSHWKRESGNLNSLSNNNVSSIWKDEKGILWIGTSGGGLNKFDRKKETFKHYLEKDGLPNSVINSILGDNEGNLWMSTNKGISKFDPKKETFKNYDVRDGLQSNEFNGGAYYKSEDGEMFFGGINGFNAFYPHEIKDNPYVPPIVITNFQILNESVAIGQKSPLKQAITETREIVLSYKDYIFSFDFAALDFTNPDKNRYAYKMEGLDRDWIYRDSKKRFATYTNLDPGEYVFRVIGSNNDGIWNQKGTSIKIIIVPPFWKTWWFTLFLLVSFAVLSYVIINFIKKYIILSGFWKREKIIGKFKLVEKIGSGGMATIYKAQDTLDKSETVAIKVLREDLSADENYRKRFKQEAAIIDQLDHPNIVKVLERGQYKQKLYIVMELLRGKTLAKKIGEEPKIHLNEVLDMMIQITDTLIKIHSKDIVHRDLKPENIMLIEKEGNCNFVKLLDFGLAKGQFQSRITQTGTVLGTLNYMAPEQIALGEFSPASDIYSLGVIFYETVTNQLPFPGESVSDIMKQIMNKTPTEPIQLRLDLPIELNQIIMEMMEKENEYRPTAKEVMEELRKIAGR